MQQLKAALPRKSDSSLQKQLTRLIGMTRGVIRPEYTNKAYEPRALGAPTAASKEVSDVRNAIHNAIHNPIQSAEKRQRRREEAIALLTEKGYADKLLSEEELKQKVKDILNTKRKELGGRSIMELVNDDQEDFSFYFGFTKRRLTDEDLQFLGRRGANRKKRKRDGKTPLNRPVLLRGDRTLPEKKRHFTPKEAREELGMDSLMLYFSEVCLNAYDVEDALQR